MARMAATGVATPCVCIGAFWKYSPADDDPDLRATALDLLTKTIEACAAIGADCILVPLTNAARVRLDEGPVEIRRRNRTREIRLSANTAAGVPLGDGADKLEAWGQELGITAPDTLVPGGSARTFL